MTSNQVMQIINYGARQIKIIGLDLGLYNIKNKQNVGLNVNIQKADMDMR